MIRKLVCSLAFLLLLAGCVSGSYGRLMNSQDLVAAYTGGQLPENYNYYYCGRSKLPYAVVGIDPKLTFQEKYWFKIESKQEVYEKISNLADLEAYHNQRYYKEILGPDGRQLGVYFSYYNSTPVIVDGQKKTIAVYNPYNPNSRDSWGG